MDLFDPKTAPGYEFQPKSDITVSEMAQVLQAILASQGSVFVPEFINHLPETCSRHFIDRREADLKKLLYLGASKA